MDIVNVEPEGHLSIRWRVSGPNRNISCDGQECADEKEISMDELRASHFTCRINQTRPPLVKDVPMMDVPVHVTFGNSEGPMLTSIWANEVTVEPSLLRQVVRDVDAVRNWSVRCRAVNSFLRTTFHQIQAKELQVHLKGSHSFFRTLLLVLLTCSYTTLLPSPSHLLPHMPHIKILF